MSEVTYPNCSEHNEKLELFCVNCEQIVCLLCKQFGNHKNHQCEPISEVAEGYRTKIWEKIGDLGNRNLELIRSGDAIIDRTEKLFDSRDRMKTVVEKEFQKLRELINRREKVLIDEIENYSKTQHDMLQEDNTRLLHWISSASKVIDQGTAAKNLPDWEFLNTYKNEIEHVDELIKKTADFEIHGKCVVPLIVNLEKVTTAIDSVGQIIELGRPSVTSPMPDQVQIRCFAIEWDSVENATSYEVQVSHAEPNQEYRPWTEVYSASGLATKLLLIQHSKYRLRLRSCGMNGAFSDWQTYRFTTSSNFADEVMFSSTTKGEELEVSADQYSVVNTADGDSYSYILGSNSFKSGTHMWRVLINSCNGYLSMGITTTADIPYSGEYQAEGTWMLFNTGDMYLNGRSHLYCDFTGSTMTFETGNIISFRLELDRKKLLVRNQTLGLSCEFTTPLESEFYPCFNLHGKGTSISLISTHPGSWSQVSGCIGTLPNGKCPGHKEWTCRCGVHHCADHLAHGWYFSCLNFTQGHAWSCCGDTNKNTLACS